LQGTLIGFEAEGGEVRRWGEGKRERERGDDREVTTMCSAWEVGTDIVAF